MLLWLIQKFALCVVLCACVLIAPRAFCQRSQTAKSQSEAPLLQTADQTNDRIMELAVADAARQGDYIIGSGDLLGIEVFEVPELSRDVRVNETGYLSIPLLPVKVQATGLTPFQLQDKLTELLQVNGLVTNPEVTISVKERHSEPITVIGAVRSPIVVQAVHQTTLLEALSQAGGITDNAGSQVIVTRVAHPPDGDDQSENDLEGQPTLIKIGINDLLDTGDPKFNIPLLGGDVVNVPRAGIVYVIGAVPKPGGFVMQSDRQGQITVLKALALSGGLAPTAKSSQAFILRQDAVTGDRRRIPVDVRKIFTLKAEDVRLLQSDILYVPDSTSKRAMRRAGELAIVMASVAAVNRLP
jgi:polysaccharide biosynthesis/export protein